MRYRDLRDFIAQLEALGELRRVQDPVSPRLEMTALADAVLRAGGPALLLERPVGHAMPCLVNLFGTTRRVALGMGADSAAELRDVGRLLAALKEPEPVRGLKDAGKLLHMAKAVWDMKPSLVRQPGCQQVVRAGDEVDLGMLPVQTCWPGDAGPLITWGLVITRGPQSVAQPEKFTLNLRGRRWPSGLRTKCRNVASAHGVTSSRSCGQAPARWQAMTLRTVSPQASRLVSPTAAMRRSTSGISRSSTKWNWMF